MPRCRGFVTAGIICLLTACLLVSCNDKPTKHDEPKGIRLYASDAVTKNLYVLNAETGELLDSIPNGRSTNLLLSSDGQYIYSNHDDNFTNYRTRKTSAKTLQPVAETPGASQLVFLENESLILRPHSDNVEFLDAATLSLVGIDSVGFLAGSVASADTVGFIIGNGEHNRLTAYDFRYKRILAADSVILPDNTFAYGLAFALTPSGKHGFGIFRDTRNRAWFIGFKTPSLELEVFYQLVFPYGDIAVSPDGRYVLFDDPGYVPPGYIVGMFFVYDAIEQQMGRIIDIDTLSLFGGISRPCVTTIDFSPAGTEAYVSTGGNGWATGPVLVFDIHTLAFNRKVDIDKPFEWMPDPIVVGPEP